MEEDVNEDPEMDSTPRNRALLEDMNEQEKIKKAVSEYTTEQEVPDQSELQPSILAAPGTVTEAPDNYAPQDYQYAEDQQQGQEYYQQYQPTSLSSDTITEIAEQVVSDKLSTIRRNLEQAKDLKTTMESRISAVDERLKRIEKIIDRLQLSVLQKVGDYVNNVEDIKKELAETQKSFKSMHEIHRKSQK